jgi:uncharacterized protein (DUF983 family)
MEMSSGPLTNTRMFNKGSILYSVFKNKCPQCQEGDFFKNTNPYHLGEFTKMHDNCPKCELKYELEPGFFYGSMYVSYAFQIAWFVTLWIATSVVVPDINKMTQFLFIASCLLVFYPLNYRLSRLLYTNFFVHYQKNEEIQS